jgi:hypothetical protein
VRLTFVHADPGDRGIDHMHIAGGRLETIVHADVPAVGQFDPVLFKTDASRVRRAYGSGFATPVG